MAKFSKEDYDAIAQALANDALAIQDAATEEKRTLTEQDIVRLGRLYALKKRVIEIQTAPVKPRGKKGAAAKAAATAAAGNHKK